MTLEEKIADTQAKLEQAVEQAKQWEQNRLVLIGRLQTLQELVAEEAAAKAEPAPAAEATPL